MWDFNNNRMPPGRYEADGKTPMQPLDPVMPSWWKPAKGMEDAAVDVKVASADDEEAPVVES